MATELVEEQDLCPVALLTKIIPHSSSRDFCTTLAPLCPRQNLVHCKQLKHTHAEELGTDAELVTGQMKPFNHVHMEHICIVEKV